MESKKTPLSGAFASPRKKSRGETTSTTSTAQSPLIDRNTPSKSLLRSPCHVIRPAAQSRALTHQELHKKTYFNDPVHGQIEMHGLCLRIIDTKQFQRLRDLKQLGTCDYVFPGATHSRFSHSLGVAHYSEVVVRKLMQNQPELGISEADLLCVKAAGLCHDLGHGPFSHVFDGVFMTRMHPKKHWRHEDWSINIFRHLLAANHINIADYGLTAQDQLFIEEIVRGTPEKERLGRPSTLFFLYDVVNNSRSGLDVDKLDYFQRDIQHTNVFTSYDQFQRFIEFGRVLPALPIDIAPQSNVSVLSKTERNTLWNAVQRESERVKDSSPFSVFSPQVQSATSQSSSSQPRAYMICYPEKMVGEALQLFMLRYQLHQKVYTHKTVKKVEFMLVDALEKADPFIFIPGTRTAAHPDGKYRMSECVEDAAALSLLTDQVVFSIETSTSEELRPAREIIARIRRRDFYSCLGKTVYKRGTKADRMTTDDIAQELLAIAESLVSDAQTGPTAEDDDAENENESAQQNDLSVLLDDEDEVRERAEGDIEDDAFEAQIQSQDSFAPWVKSTIHSSFHRTISNNTSESLGLSINSQQDCFALSQSVAQCEHSNGANPYAGMSLSREDVIVEKMHIHYGLKGENPVSRLRFYAKEMLFEDNAALLREDVVAMPVKESTYETLLPRVFEELAVRVFCRDKRKNRLLAEAYQTWCREYNNSSTPFPSVPSHQ